MSWSVAIPSLLSAIIGAGAALFGAWLVGRHQRETQREALREASLTKERQLVVDVLTSCRAWARSQLAYLPLCVKGTIDDLVEFADTDSGRKLGRLVEEMDLALVAARLFLADDDLKAIVGSLAVFKRDFPEAVIGPMLSKTGGTPEQLATGWSAVRSFEKTLNQLEEQAVSVLRSQIQPRAERRPRRR